MTNEIDDHGVELPDVKKLSNDDLKRMVAAFLVKHQRVGPGDTALNEWLEGVIGTVVVDTILVVDGYLTIEDFEETG